MRQGFSGTVLAGPPPSSHSAVANTVTRTNLWVPAIWTPIPALDLAAGRTYRLRAGGIISTTATPTIIFTPTFGQSATPASNISLGGSITLTLGTLSSAPWKAEFTLIVRSLGVAASTSSVVGSGEIVIGGAAATASQVLAVGGTVVTTADHSSAQGLCLDVTWGTASVSNTVTAQWTRLVSED